ncbi:MAG TPA: hypothetical protein VGK74_08550 [Symbiobacteriaceae bacterium]|jgi:hypothetical protein
MGLRNTTAIVAAPATWRYDPFQAREVIRLLEQSKAVASTVSRQVIDDHIQIEWAPGPGIEAELGITANPGSNVRFYAGAEFKYDAGCSEGVQFRCPAGHPSPENPYAIFARWRDIGFDETLALDCAECGQAYPIPEWDQTDPDFMPKCNPVFVVSRLVIETSGSLIHPDSELLRALAEALGVRNLQAGYLAL